MRNRNLSKVAQDETYFDPKWMPEQNLMHYVIDRALIDLKGPDSFHRIWWGKHKMVPNYDKLDALTWIFDDSTEAFSFNWICLHIYGEGGAEKIRAQYEKKLVPSLLHNKI